jgi:arylsulfatase A-like enzyme
MTFTRRGSVRRERRVRWSSLSSPHGVVRLLVGVFLCAVTLLGGCQRSAPPKQPNVLLITIDTLRADHVGVYGYPLDTTPTIDALAARGVRFADTTVPWPKTWPAMAAMITGKHPQTNGIRLRPRRPLPAENVTLAEVLRDAGYATGAVVANVNLGRTFGFDQGFDRFVESWAAEAKRLTGKARFRNAPGLVKRFTNGRIVTDQGIAALDALGAGADKPFFLWLHYIDPHGPYVPPPAYASLFAGAHPPAPVPLEDLPSYQLQIDPATGLVSNDIGFYETQYDREIRSVDDQIGRLLAALDERGLTRDTLVVLTADHGESMDENRYYLEHGNVPYQTNAAAPMIFVLDGRFAPGRVVDEPVGVIDVFATVLALTGTAPPPGVASANLVPALDGDASPPPYVFMEAGKYEPFQLVARKGPWKLVHLRSPKDRAWLERAEFELYDLSNDPTEQTDVREEHPEVAAELEAALIAWQKSTPRYTGEARTDLEQLDGRTQEMLRALGYLE